jgi:hypothetical protein
MRTMMRRLAGFAVFAVSVAIAGVVSGAGDAHSSSAAVAAAPASENPRRTAVHYYVAFKNGGLAPGLKVTERVRGTCDNGSEVEGRPFVWRCGWHEKRFSILGDPCFSATATSRSTFCPEAPWSKRGALVLLKQPLRGWKPTHPQIIPTWPWGVWTTTGKRCRAIRTGTSVVNGMRVNHACTGGGILIGPVTRRATRWTIYYAPDDVAGSRHARLTRVGITDAWW